MCVSVFFIVIQNEHVWSYRNKVVLLQNYDYVFIHVMYVSPYMLHIENNSEVEVFNF